MTSVILIDKFGVSKEQNIKSLNLDNLYKKCGYKKPDNFEKQAVWKVEMDNKVYNCELYGKRIGKANFENKYDFPPPIDSTLFFGTMILVNINEDEEIIDLKLSEWNLIYEKLFGGFEDLNSEASSEDELKNVPADKKSKGYLKDDFVVSDSDVESSTESSNGEIKELDEEPYYYTDDEN